MGELSRGYVRANQVGIGLKRPSTIMRSSDAGSGTRDVTGRVTITASDGENYGSYVNSKGRFRCQFLHAHMHRGLPES